MHRPYRLCRLCLLSSALTLCLFLLLSSCTSTHRHHQCSELAYPDYTNHQLPPTHLAISEAVLYSVTLTPDNHVSTPCGSSLSCLDVAAYISGIGGIVDSINNCNVSWHTVDL